MLSVEGVTIRSPKRTLVKEASLEIKPGEWFALVGQSGSGKSLLSRSIGGLLPQSLSAEGSILFEGAPMLELDKKSRRQLLGKRLAYVFQDFSGSFAPFRTIGQHVDELVRAHDKGAAGRSRERAESALEAVGLGKELVDRYPFQLSGGQLQRSSIALALLFAPPLLIADEVTTALDSVAGHRILQLLQERRHSEGSAILFITHDWRHVRRYADRIAVMKDGKIVESGGKHRVLDHPQHDYTKQLIAAAPILDGKLPSGLSGGKRMGLNNGDGYGYG